MKKNKFKILLLFLSVGLLSTSSFCLKTKVLAQEDTSTGWIPDYAIVEIEKMKDELTDEQWEEIEYFIATRNYYALKHALVTISAFGGGVVSIIASNIVAAFFSR